MLKINSLYASCGKKQILHGITLDVPKGSFTALIGKNGCGKSTLVSCLGSALDFKGEITVNGRSFNELSRRERAKEIAVMPQLLPNPKITVEELVYLGRNPYLSLSQKASDTDKAEVEKALTSAELTDFRHRTLNTLSGGELRRAYLGMVLAQSTKIIVLDEATAYMDIENESKLLSTVKAQNKTVLCVMHDLSAAVEFADRIVLMESGKIKFCASAQAALKEEIIEKSFGVSRYISESEKETRIFFAR
ncbi:MAG: ABC transporter ATP-binding protein [Clostridia bacterium]|nr:ABC transporter ATP-binding protein [Clostridia bacterium]